MKNAITSLLVILTAASVQGQSLTIDSLNKLISNATTDTGRINLELKKISQLSEINIDSAISLSLITLDQALRIHYYRGVVDARRKLASNYCFKGNYKDAAEQLNTLDHFLKPSKDSADFGSLYGVYGLLYSMQGKYDSSIHFYEKAIRILEQTDKTESILSNYINIAIAYQQQSNFPMALFYQQKTLKMAEDTKDETDQAYAYINMAIIYASINDLNRAEKTYLKTIDVAKKNQLKQVELYAYANLSSLYLDKKEWRKAYSFAMNAAILGKQTGDLGIQASSLSRAAVALMKNHQSDSAIALSDKAIAVADSSRQPLNKYQTYSDRGQILYIQGKFEDAIKFYEKGLLSVSAVDIYSSEFGYRYNELSECYEKTGQFTKALEALKKTVQINDSVTSKDNIQKSTELAMNYDFDKKQQLQQVEQKSKDAVQTTRQLVLVTALAFMLVLTVVVYIGFKNKQKANVLVSQKKEEIEKTLAQLKLTQVQLIQSEKMASLGELTAGIAHEIQNPLNFVNNFSEVNTELIDETELAIDEGKSTEAKALLKSLRDNQLKINHHGKRADAIVKGMLQHSRANTGHKELTDINALVDEYLRLAYHGFRSKEKDFNTKMTIDFDPGIGKINIIPQDIGRVLLNIYNNAYYAVAEKKKQMKGEYEPNVSVSTGKLGDKVEIKIKDNGNGIPGNIKDKIFQPFFTTKPTGQGTGLGLSLSYDIIKTHGGEIKVETIEGESTEFTILLSF